MMRWATLVSLQLCVLVSLYDLRKHAYTGLCAVPEDLAPVASPPTSKRSSSATHPVSSLTALELYFFAESCGLCCSQPMSRAWTRSETL
jgi:hypothetical protein